MNHPFRQSDLAHRIVTLEKSKSAVVLPPMYNVIILNDDYTPMDFVVDILVKFFHMSLETATRTMLKIHQLGSAICGVYTLEIAETKTQQVNTTARSNQHPLRCEIERVEIRSNDPK